MTTAVTFFRVGFAAVVLLMIQRAMPAQEVNFTRDIRPILSDKCFHCHGNDEKTREAGLRLDIRAEAIEMEAIVAGSAADSAIWDRINSDDEGEVMPPPHTHKTITGAEKELIQKWLEQGAKYEEHWSYRPIEKTKLEANGRSPIDVLLDRSLKDHNLVGVAPADRETLIRRLSLDLMGLPPTYEQVQQFVNDQSENAYEKLVDRLLSQDAYGERMAVFWLDLVRYADTIGYHNDIMMEVSAYRDYVINAFNANKPFDEFTIEQLAGDLLPNPTEEQKIASGYNRLLQTTAEGGAQPKEYIAIYAADRVRNVSGVWMGQTMGCAQCHDHKYDPITTKDFYSMSAFFADLRETPVGAQPKNMFLFTDKEKAKRKLLETELANVRKTLGDFRQGSELRKTEQSKWESALAQSIGDSMADDTDDESTVWRIPVLSNVSATHGQLKEIGDGSFLSIGDVPKSSDYKFDIELDGEFSVFRLEALTDPSFKVDNGLSRSNGNFVLTDLEIQHNGKKVMIASAKADHQSTTGLATNVIDNNQESGWSVDGHRKRDGRRVIILRLEKPIDLSSGGTITVHMRHQSVYAGHNIGRFRISVPVDQSTDAKMNFDASKVIAERTKQIIQIPAEKRTDEQQRLLNEAFLDASTTMVRMVNRMAQIKRSLQSLKDNVRTMLISDALPKPRMTKIKNRGDWMDESGEIVQPAVPEFLPSKFDGDERRLTRLDLAKWLVEPSNPLTSRTFVNRLWKVYFGRGISNNLDDLGGQGEAPTHPELLDWLAADFQSDWNVKRMVKSIVMTDAYRRSSIADAKTVQADPGNFWYARQGRWRIDAEFVRDSALQLAGLLEASQIGGRSVKPYQPAGYWQHLNFPKRKWHQDAGNKLYRKSLYTFWCRSFLHPTMLAFDAPTREECVASRARSNIPQQALVRLNDPIFVEASRGFGVRMMQMEGTPREKIRHGWQQAVGRPAAEQEVELLVKLFEQQKTRFAEAADDAEALSKIGESKVPAGVDVKELAAWTQVARAILNTYEMISRY